MTGEGLAAAIFLVYMMAALYYLGAPLLFGHYLLLAGRNWSYRSYLLFGILTGPTATQRIFGGDNYMISLMGILLGGISALALRLILHRSREGEGEPSILSGRLRTRPMLAVIVAAGLTSLGTVTMRLPLLRGRLSTDSLQYMFETLMLGSLILIGALTLTVWLVSFLKRRFGHIKTILVYGIAAVMAQLLTIIVTVVRYYASFKWGYLLDILFYRPLSSIFWIIALAWTGMAIYQNLIGPNVPAEPTRPNPE